MVRLIDVRCGDALQSLTVPSLLGQKSHAITRVLWYPLDEDCLFVGDTCGYVHVFDVRCTRKSVQVIEAETCLSEPVVCLSLTKNKMNLLTSHGQKNALNLWTLADGRFVNSMINFPTPAGTFKSAGAVSKSNAHPALLKCQTHVTDECVFNPVSDTTGRIGVYDLETGDVITFLSPSSFNRVYTSCVNGLDQRLVLYSGSRRYLRKWSIAAAVTDAEQRRLTQFYQDTWSDSD